MKGLKLSKGGKRRSKDNEWENCHVFLDWTFLKESHEFQSVYMLFYLQAGSSQGR